MQKIGKFLIVAYVVLVTAACAVFATLYFVNNPRSASALTREEAIVLVDKACKDRGITTTISQGISATSLDPTTYEGEEFADMGGYQSYTLMHDSGLLTAKCLLESDLQENVWYDDSTNWGGLYRYWIDGQSVYFEQCSNNDYQNEDFYPHCVMNVVTKTGNDTYKSEFFYQILTTVYDSATSSSINGCLVDIHVYFEADKDGAYLMHMESFSYKQRKVVPTAAVSNLNNVVGARYYDCNLKTHKLVDRLSTETAINLLSNDEKLEIVNRLILTGKNFFNGTKKLADFGEIKPQNDANVLKPVNDWMASKMGQGN